MRRHLVTLPIRLTSYRSSSTMDPLAWIAWKLSDETGNMKGQNVYVTFYEFGPEPRTISIQLDHYCFTRIKVYCSWPSVHRKHRIMTNTTVVSKTNEAEEAKSLNGSRKNEKNNNEVQKVADEEKNKKHRPIHESIVKALKRTRESKGKETKNKNKKSKKTKKIKSTDKNEGKTPKKVKRSGARSGKLSKNSKSSVPTPGSESLAKVQKTQISTEKCEDTPDIEISSKKAKKVTEPKQETPPAAVSPMEIKKEAAVVVVEAPPTPPPPPPLEEPSKPQSAPKEQQNLADKAEESTTKETPVKVISDATQVLAKNEEPPPVPLTTISSDKLGDFGPVPTVLLSNRNSKQSSPAQKTPPSLDDTQKSVKRKRENDVAQTMSTTSFFVSFLSMDFVMTMVGWFSQLPELAQTTANGFSNWLAYAANISDEPVEGREVSFTFVLASTLLFISSVGSFISYQLLQSIISVVMPPIGAVLLILLVLPMIAVQRMTTESGADVLAEMAGLQGIVYGSMAAYGMVSMPVRYLGALTSSFLIHYSHKKSRRRVLALVGIIPTVVNVLAGSAIGLSITKSFIFDQLLSTACNLFALQLSIKDSDRHSQKHHAAALVTLTLAGNLLTIGLFSS